MTHEDLQPGRHTINFDPNRPAKEIVSELEEKGVEGVTTQGVRKVITGVKSGSRMQRRVEAAGVISEELSVVRKDDFLLKFATEGMATRTRGTNGRWNSLGFVGHVSNALNVDRFVAGSLIRTMRAEIVLAEQNREDVPASAPSFLASYCADYSGSRHPSPNISRLAREWDGNSIADFYRKYYEIVTEPIVQRTLPPYEMEMFVEYYMNRILKGSPQSSLDRLVLDQIRTRASLPMHIEAVRNLTGVAYNINSHDALAGMLLVAKPNPVK